MLLGKLHNLEIHSLLIQPIPRFRKSTTCSFNHMIYFSLFFLKWPRTFPQLPFKSTFLFPFHDFSIPIFLIPSYLPFYKQYQSIIILFSFFMLGLIFALFFIYKRCNSMAKLCCTLAEKEQFNGCE
jgi:hypothetical protein